MDIKKLIAELIAVATGEIDHAGNGLCPDPIEGFDSRDPDCPACKILTDAAAEHDEMERRLNALKKRCYIFSESHLSGYRLIIGFNTLDDVQGAHQQIIRGASYQAQAGHIMTPREHICGEFLDSEQPPKGMK